MSALDQRDNNRFDRPHVGLLDEDPFALGRTPLFCSEWSGGPAPDKKRKISSACLELGMPTARVGRSGQREQRSE